jgi:NADH dehydrogenase [ubiquinone] 1 alpha subcomplex assembly factor 5
METAPQIFDRKLVRRRRTRHAASLGDADFLLKEIAERLAERLDDLTTKFPTAVALGSRGGIAKDVLADRGGIIDLIESDLAPPDNGVLVDAEVLPFKKASLDLVFAASELHVVNDLPGALVQIRQALRPDGLFLGTLFGPATLGPLRQAFLEAESMLDAPVAPHVAPFVDIRDAAALLQRAGFALPVADTEVITVSYGEPFKLLADLRAMGEANVLFERSRRPMRRDVLMKMMERLTEIAGGPDGRLSIPFEIVFLAGWTPAPTQQQPLSRGSGQVSLTEALKPKN